MGGRGTNSTVQQITYDRIPLTVVMGGRRYSTPEEQRQARDTVNAFIRDAQAGNQYRTGAGLGSEMSDFEVVAYNRSPNGLGIRAGNRTVAMTRSNIMAWIKNGATLVRRGGK